MSVNVSDMKTPKKRQVRRKASPELPDTFTVRDMNRNTQIVLSAARQHGHVTIRSRSGEQFRIEAVRPAQAEAGPRPDFLERMRMHRENMRALGVEGPRTAEAIERMNRIIAGEE
jgi:hypothetical protein